ncbi:MAG: fasciclin domain-containing protein [Odoribacteraceae bacterium]|jgi:hypothetical protein|nr:fasciclin domain-containing protein [Odoribacteraceae bacterium]
MKNIVTGIILTLLAAACSTDWNFENTGLARERFDGTMYEYLKSNPYDWDSVRLVIERAGMVDMFDGGEEFTFFGPTNHSIRRWMNNNSIAAIRDIPVAECASIVNDHVLDGTLARDDIPEGEFTGGSWKGGKAYTFRSGKSIMIYRLLGSYMNVPKAGAAEIHLNQTTSVASSNIRPTNGIVHSLVYSYILGTL